MAIFKDLIFVGRKLKLKRFLQFIINVYFHPSCGRLVAKYICTCTEVLVSTQFDNICTLLTGEYLLTPAGVLFLLLKYQM